MQFKKPSVLALIGYALLSILMTWPTAANLTTAIPGDGFDGWQNYWNQWWIKEALLNRQTHFFFTDLLYPPSGVSLLFHTLNYFNGLWTLPLQLNFGLTVAYNAVVFFHFIFAGFGVYLLARYTLAQLGFRDARAAWAAFAAGVIFTFSPFHLAHLLGHMQVLSLTWVPFYILWILRITNYELRITNYDLQAANAAEQNLPFTIHHSPFTIHLFLAGLFLTFTTMVDWYQSLYMLLFTALALAWTLWRVWRDSAADLKTLLKPVIGLAAMGLAVGLIFSPLILPMAREAVGSDYMRPAFEENVILSADLLAFVTPSELNPLWGDYFLPLYQHYTTTTSERLIFAGFIPLILAGLAAARYWRKRLAQFWLLFTAVFFVLALGPYLHVLGNIVKIGGIPLPMPYLLLYKFIPFIGISRSLSRFDLMVMIGLGVLAAVGMARLKIWQQGALTALICLEFLAIPYPMSAVDTPDFFYTLAKDAESYNIAALPMNWDRPSPLLYQTAHHKGLLTAYTSRNNPLDLSWRAPVFQQWRALGDDIIKTDLPAVAPTILRDFNLRYIVLDYYQMPPGPEREGTEKWVSAALPGLQPFYQDERLTVYQSPEPAQRVPYVQLGDGWGALNAQAAPPTRTMAAEATLTLAGAPISNAQLTIQTAAPASLRGLQAIAGDRLLPVSLSADSATAIIELPAAARLLTLRLPAPVAVNRIELQY
ncbi:MAG TPA: hypothetical protein G4N96_04725 [Chloroflexi bacterium]|nr:MAG: hypothetical protein B6243_04565 [Anaerolineaceae bacterium 4572_5.2]HEY84405.1 hypothetical protein [Chloroflexota bacterium]